MDKVIISKEAKMKNTFMISFDNVSKSYGSKILFENVTFNINK